MKKKVFNLIKYICIFMLIAYILIQLTACSVSPTSQTAQQLAGAGNPASAPKTLSKPLATAIKLFITVIQVAGAGIAVIMVTISAIEYFTSAAASAKAQGHNHMLNWLFYGFLIIAIPQIIIKILDNTLF